ncbi:hypothetical protein SAMN05444172_5427 [Burkholderia sp. GAS332]|nr:hypothetical protein SAMN05444172_5427 [Burkholderia sp. GAS332]
MGAIRFYLNVCETMQRHVELEGHAVNYVLLISE